MNMLKKRKLFLVITHLLAIHHGFAQLPSDAQNQDPLPAAVPIDEFIVPMLLIAILFAGYFFRLKNKKLKESNNFNTENQV